jgi:hypothetical protein
MEERLKLMQWNHVKEATDNKGQIKDRNQIRTLLIRLRKKYEDMRRFSDDKSMSL